METFILSLAIALIMAPIAANADSCEEKCFKRYGSGSRGQRCASQCHSPAASSDQSLRHEALD
jgi:hypothetical protein